MPFTVEHNYRFDAAGKLDADDWVLVPRQQLRADFALDVALADRMAQRYFEIISGTNGGVMKVSRDTQGVRYVVPLGKTAMVFAEPERTVDNQRAETSWRIVGGFLLAHRINYGGRFYLGAEWQDPQTLKLYSSIRRYPPRLINWLGVSRGVAVYHRTQGRAHKQAQEKYLAEIAQSVTAKPESA